METIETITTLNERMQDEIGRVLKSLDWHVLFGKKVLTTANVVSLTRWSEKTLQRRAAKLSVPVLRISGRNYYEEESVREILYDFYNLK
ncbi:MAG: hypothetical protein LRY50_14110 [Geovibrio sp.]|nr:hypothetical protein [Geovibrio sp.]